jgi:hypothetical protein
MPSREQALRASFVWEITPYAISASSNSLVRVHTELGVLPHTGTHT